VGELHAQLDTHETQLDLLESTGTVAAVTATTDGLTTGLVPATASHVTVTCGNSAHIITLPTASVGKRIVVFWGLTAGHVRTAASSNIKVNGTDADSAVDADIPASHLVVFTKVGASDWIASAVDSVGAAYTVVVA
jgi:hypothetical protein